MSSNHSLKELARAIFSSDEFFSDRAFFGLVKQPVEYVATAIRLLGATYNQGTTAGDRRATNNTPYTAARNQGQNLLDPPDVAGWDFNLGWINTASMLERYNFVNAFLTNRNTTNPGVFVTDQQLDKYTKGSTKKTVKKFLNLLGPLSIDGETTSALRNYLSTGDNGQPTTFTDDAPTRDKKVRGLVHLIMALPEFQLN
jgi:uncharacterized protein (DUF1800 family)